MNQQAYKKAGAGNEDPLMVYFRTLKNESDRGQVLLLAAKVDELLEKLLKSYFKQKRNKEDDYRLFGPIGPLGSFAIRTEIAYRVGLISKATADCLDILREIRNDCAHGLEPISLETGKHSKRFEEFKKLTYKISGMKKFWEVVELLDAAVNEAQGSTTKEPTIMSLAIIHLLLLQSMLKDVQMVGDSFSNFENLDVWPSGLAFKR